MSYLGTILELEHGSRLTGIGLRPLAREVMQTHGLVYLHVVTLYAGDSATAASGAAATFMPAALATIDGNQPDGGTWFATFQFAADDRDPLRAKRTADAGIMRALDLTGVDGEYLWGLALRASDLREAYAEAGAGDVSEWSVADLLTGVLIGLANISLATIVAGCESAGHPNTRREHRLTRLRDFLDSWAATVEGPEA